MNKVVVPATGIQIHHDRLDSKTPPQIIRLNLSESITKDLIHALKENAQAQVKLGKRPTITFGTRNVPLNHGTDKFPVEMYSRAIDGSEPIQFAGKLSHTLESQHAKEVTARVDKALANLKRTLHASLEDRATAGSGSGLTGNKLLNAHRSSALSSGFLSSRPSSPFLGSLSPRVGPTSAPLQTATITKEKIRLDAIKVPLIHLLAVDPCSSEDLARKLRVKRSECDKVLEKVARDSKGGKKELKDKAYRDLDVWKFKYQSQNDRQLAIEHAVSAYDRMRVEKTDQLWQMLLAKEDRGKGIYLSKLNFDKPLATGNLTPKIPERSTDGSVEGKSTSSDQTSKKSNTTNTKLTDDLPKTKASAGVNAKTAALKEMAKVGILSKDGNKPKPVKQESRYKSAEKVEDSDEEGTATKTLPTPKQPAQKKQPVVGRSIGEKSLPSTSKAPLHKSQLSVSSLGGSDVDQGRLAPSSAMARKRPAAEAQEGKERGAPRARNGSSPVKPSPLGSSPPTNSRDIDSSSNSSKSTSQSSAPSSPPSSNELSTLKKDYSPVVSDKKNDQLTNGVKKRKADTGHDQPPAKRQTLHNNANISHDRAQGASKVNGETAKDSKRGSPDSDQFSASDKPITRQGVEYEARQFKKYWDRYKELHDRLEKLSESHRDPTDVEKLWKMHTRLKEMKEQIWRDWEKVEKLEPK